MFKSKKSMALFGWVIVIVLIIVALYYFSPEMGNSVTQSIGKGLGTIGEKGADTVGNMLNNGGNATP